MFDEVPTVWDVLTSVDSAELPDSIQQILKGTTPHLQGAQLDFDKGTLIPPPSQN